MQDAVARLTGHRVRAAGTPASARTGGGRARGQLGGSWDRRRGRALVEAVMGPYGMCGTRRNAAPDYVAEMRALEVSHPTLTWIRPAAGGPHAAVWMEDDGPHREERESLRELVLYLRARLGL